MSDPEYARVVGDAGLSGYMLGPSDRGGDEVAIALDSGREISVPASALHRQANGDWRLDESVAGASQLETAEQQVMPVIAEDLTVRRRKVSTGTVRVGTAETTHDETVSMPLTRERAVVRRVVIDKPVESAPPIRREGDTIIFPVVEEVAVVQKHLVLKEEIHVSRKRTTEQHEQTVTLREEHPVVERIDQAGRSTVDTVAPPPQLQGREAVRNQLLAPKQKKSRTRRNKVL